MLKTRIDGSAAASTLKLVVHGVGAWSPAAARPKSQTDLYARLDRWGFPVVPVRRAVGDAELAAAVAAVGVARPLYPFPSDGAVIKVDAWSDQQVLGSSRLAPRWALARKFDAPRAVTQLRGVSWQIGRTGTLTPVAELDPVVIAGSTVARVSLHHAEEVARRDLHVGDWVVVEKAGEVIPVLVGVEVSRRSVTYNRIRIPDDCPACGARLERNGALRCASAACPARLRRRLEHFTSRTALNIPLGPRAIEALVAQGRLRNLPDLYRLDVAVLRPVIGEKETEKVMAALARSKEAPLERVLIGYGLPQVGPVAARALARHFGRTETLLGATLETLRAVPELAPGRLDQLYRSLQDATTQEEWSELLQLGVGRARSEPAAQTPMAGDVGGTGG
jgi:DNA ligase (NAD+)